MARFATVVLCLAATSFAAEPLPDPNTAFVRIARRADGDQARS